MLGLYSYARLEATAMALTGKCIKIFKDELDRREAAREQRRCHKPPPCEDMVCYCRNKCARECSLRHPEVT